MTRYPVFPGRGPISFGRIAGTQDGEYRRHRASTGIFIENKMSVDSIAGDALREGFKGDALDREVRFRALRSFVLPSAAEMLPNAARMTIPTSIRQVPLFSRRQAMPVTPPVTIAALAFRTAETFLENLKNL